MASAVQNGTSEPEELSSNDFSGVTTVIEELTEEAINSPEVCISIIPGFIIFYLPTPNHNIGQGKLSADD